MPIEIDVVAPSPPPPLGNTDADESADAVPDFVYPLLGVLLLLLLCCHRCCLPAIVRGFCGRWAQLRLTHSNALIPPLYLPKQQRLAIGAALHDDGETLAKEVAQFLGRDVAVATLLRVTLVKQRPNQPVGLQLVDLVTEANGWRREKNGGGGEYYVHVKSRTTLAASPGRWELAPRVHGLDSSSLAARSELLQINDALLSVDGCTGDASFLTAKLSAAHYKVELLIERTVREGQAPADAVPAADPPRCAGRRDSGWVEAKVGWWSHQQGALSEGWSQQWSRDAAPQSPGRLRSQGDSATSRVAASTDTPDARLAVPSAEVGLGWFGMFQLRRELPPAQRPRAGVGEWQEPRPSSSTTGA
tara:strand:- start:218 stop:1297 length:1080 start_codon:yes stop_codon:yes gene_type:complete